MKSTGPKFKNCGVGTVEAHDECAGRETKYQNWRTSNGFFLLVSTASPKAEQYCFANLFGPHVCNFQRHALRIDASESTHSLISYITSTITKKIITYITKQLKKLKGLASHPQLTVPEFHNDAGR